jgi:hypothetical protein
VQELTAEPTTRGAAAAWLSSGIARKRYAELAACDPSPRFYSDVPSLIAISHARMAQLLISRVTGHLLLARSPLSGLRVNQGFGNSTVVGDWLDNTRFTSQNPVSGYFPVCSPSIR